MTQPVTWSSSLYLRACHLIRLLWQTWSLSIWHSLSSDPFWCGTTCQLVPFNFTKPATWSLSIWQSLSADPFQYDRDCQLISSNMRQPVTWSLFICLNLSLDPFQYDRACHVIPLNTTPLASSVFLSFTASCWQHHDDCQRKDFVRISLSMGCRQQWWWMPAETPCPPGTWLRPPCDLDVWHGNTVPYTHAVAVCRHL